MKCWKCNTEHSKLESVLIRVVDKDREEYTVGYRRFLCHNCLMKFHAYKKRWGNSY